MINNNSASDQREGANSRSIKTTLSLRGRNLELSVEKTKTPVIVWLEREIMTMMNIM